MLTLSFVVCTFFADPSKHVPIALENSPKSAQNMAKKCSNRARIFEKVLEILE